MKHPTKLNIGAGGRRIEGFTGVDVVKRPGADIIAPAHKIPLKAGTVDEIMAIHVWEHFYRWECDTVITEWKRLLKPGGRLVLEMPDLFKCCQNILSGRMEGGKHPDQLGMWGCYGDPRTGDQWMAHRWGWAFATLQPFLAGHGFKDITEHPTQFHPAGREHRDFRLEAVRA